MDFVPPLNLGNRNSTGKQNLANLYLNTCMDRAINVSPYLDDVLSFGTAPPSEVSLTNADVLAVTEIYTVL